MSNSDPIVENSDEVPQSLVDDVTKMFFDRYASIASEIDDDDLKLVFESPKLRYVERVLERQHCNTEKATEQIVQILKWRKSEKLTHLTDNSFPTFFHEYGSCFIHGTDNEGNVAFYVRTKRIRNYHSAMKEAFRKFFFHVVFKADAIGAEFGKGWVMIIDVKGASIFHADIGFFIQSLKLYVNYCPSGLKRIIVCNMYNMFKPLFTAATAVLPKSVHKLILFVDEKTIFNFITKENLPQFLGGLEKEWNHNVPQGCPSVKEFMDTYYPEAKSYDKALNKYIDVLKEDREECMTLESHSEWL